MINIKTNFSKISLDIQGKCEKLKNMKPVMERIAGDMVKESQMNFQNGQSPSGEKWKELSSLTTSMRRKGSSKPLVDTGTLRRSIKGKATSTQAIAGTNLIYAPIHQFGGTIKPRSIKRLKVGKYFKTQVVIPERPYLGVNKRMGEKYRRWVVEWIR